MLGDLVGVLGGLFISVTELRVGADFYLNSLIQVLLLGDVASGIGKSFFFAYFIGIIACRNGLGTTGADGVGRATTATVVAASITVLVSDFFLTKLFLLT